MENARRTLLAWLCLFAIALAGCNTGKGVTDTSITHSRVRTVNLIAGASGPLDVTVDNNTLISGLAFEGLGQYQEVDAGTRSFQATVEGSSASTLNTTVALTGATDYTLVMFGSVASAGSVIVSDKIIDPGAGNFGMRLINGAPGASVDIYVTPPGANLDTTTPSISGVAYGSASGVANLPAGTVEIRVTPANSKQIIYDSATQNFGERATIDAVIYTRGSGNLVNLALLNISDAGASSIANSSLAQFKVINGSAVPSPLNVFVNGELVLSNIPYPAASSYQKTSAGTPTLTVEATATPGAALLALTPTLGAASDTSIVLTGTAGALDALVLSDNNLPPSSTRARVRVVNSSANLDAVDVYVNFSKQLTALGRNAAAPAIELDADATAGTPYEFDFNLSGTTQAALKLPGVTLLGGATYSIYLVGPSTALAAIVTEDR